MSAVTLCGSCGARIRWVRTQTGKAMPVDEVPHPMGHVVFTGVGDTVRVLDGSQLPHEGAAWRSHFASCPDADRHRRPRGGRRPALPTGPSCAGCGTPLDVDLVIETGATVHPTCEEPTPPAPDEPALFADLAVEHAHLRNE